MQRIILCGRSGRWWMMCWASCLLISPLLRNDWPAQGQPRSSKIGWPAYSAVARETLAMDTHPFIVSDLRGAERRLLSQLPWFDTNGDHRSPPRGAEDMLG